MKKFVFISVLSLLFFFSNAQNHGVSLSYAPWGYERIRTHATVSGVDEPQEVILKGYHSFLKPVLKFDFETHWGSTIHLIEAAYSTADLTGQFTINTTDTTSFSFSATYNVKQLGIYWHPGFVIMPQRRVQIPVFAGMGFNYYFSDVRLFMFDLSLMAQVRVYLINQLALFGAYSMHYGFTKQSSGFKHFPEIGLIYEF
ncbi:MAG: hypothetical protein K5846_00765 [Bacteroidales bacterium]|nr:hypothetical protein [Bacteroidales bacterium]